MYKKDYLISFVFALLAFFSRAPLIEKYQSYWDGPDYSIALVHFSLAEHTPTPPGYPLYIALGKIFHLFIQDPHIAILAVSVFASILSAVALYIVGTKMYNRFVGIAATIIYLTGSTFYYFGLTPYGYGLMPGVEVLLGYCVYQIFIKHKYNGYLFGIIIGILFGIRPQELLQIFPLVFSGLYFLPKKEKFKALGLCIIITLLWLIPLIYSTGSIQAYIMLNYNGLLSAAVGNSIFTHVEVMIKGFLLSFGLSTGFLLYYVWYYFKNKKINKIAKKYIIFYSIWILPGFLYNLLLRSDQAGYQMSYLSAFLLLIPFALWASTMKKKLLYIFAIIIVAVFNLYWFFYNRDPNYTKPYRFTSFHYSDIRKNDLIMSSKINFVQNKFAPKTTYIIATDALWRPYSYYLKTYHITCLFALNNIAKPYIYNQIDGINWDINWHQNYLLVVTIPSNITTVVLMDNSASNWVKKYPIKTYHLPGNSIITSFSVKPNEKLIYGYHTVEIIK